MLLRFWLFCAASRFPRSSSHRVNSRQVSHPSALLHFANSLQNGADPGAGSSTPPPASIVGATAASLLFGCCNGTNILQAVFSAATTQLCPAPNRHGAKLSVPSNNAHALHFRFFFAINPPYSPVHTPTAHIPFPAQKSQTKPFLPSFPSALKNTSPQWLQRLKAGSNFSRGGFAPAPIFLRTIKLPRIRIPCKIPLKKPSRFCSSPRILVAFFKLKSTVQSAVAALVGVGAKGRTMGAPFIAQSFFRRKFARHMPSHTICIPAILATCSSISTPRDCVVSPNTYTTSASNIIRKARLK